MTRKWMRSGIGIKLAIVFSFGLTCGILILSNIAIYSVKRFGELSASKNESNIREQAYYFLAGITQEQADRYEESFQQFANLSSLIAYQAEVYLDRIDLYGAKNLNSKEQLTVYPKNGIFANSASDRISVTYWDRPTIPATTKTQINALSHLDPLLEKAQKSNPSAVAAWVLMESGFVRYYPNTHLVDLLPPKTEDDLRNGIFYTIAKVY